MLTLDRSTCNWPLHARGTGRPSESVRVRRGDRMRHGRGGRKLERGGPPSALGESAAVGGAGRSSPDLSTTEVQAGDAGTSMPALVPLGGARSRPRRIRGVTLQEGRPRNNCGECSDPPVSQKRKNMCWKRKRTMNAQSFFVRCMGVMNQKRKNTCRKRKRTTNKHTLAAEPIPELPDVIVLDILVRLPVKSLLRCKSVCKGWCDIITDPFFVRSHLQRSASRYEQDPCLLITPHNIGYVFNSYHIHFYQWQQGASMATLMHNKHFGSEFRFIYCFAQCDGLVLVPTDSRLYLFNPATRETITLPHGDSYRHHISIRACSCAGLGLDPRTGKHKVVRAFYRSMDPDTGLGADMGMEVFTVSGNNNVGGSAWRVIKDDLLYPVANNTGTAVNGFLFWRLDYRHRDMQCPWGLLRLSLADETFGITRLPGPVLPDGFELDVLRRELCMLARICKDTVTMWILPIQEDGGQGQTWEQRYTVHLPYVFRPLAFLPGGRMLLCTQCKVCIYDTSTAKVTTVCRLDRMKYQGRRARTWDISFHVHLYTESLVRISV